MKKPNTLNYPILYSKKHEYEKHCMKKKQKFLNLAMFSKNIENFWDIAKISWILFG